jgi:hypothetical protein
MNVFFFNVFLWVMGIVGNEDRPEERVLARGRCREVVAQDTEVKIKFTCEEDAELFAKDLKEFLSTR